MLRLGLDIGGTKMEGILLDAAGHELMRRRIPTPQGYQAFLGGVSEFVNSFLAQAGEPATVGIGLPGAERRDNRLIKNANCLFLNGQSLRHDLEERLGQPVWLANDADCFTLSEARDGAGTGNRVVFGVILGTGCGGGIVVDNRLLGGPNALTGEWGHNPLPGYDPSYDGAEQTCYCGRSNCIERFVSGTGFAVRFAARYGSALSAPAILAAAASGDACAEAHYAHFVDALARSLASVINLLDPDVIVFGGGLSNLESLYQDLALAVPNWVFGEQCRTRLLPARHGDSSGVRGAAWLPELHPMPG
ncbi:fructokinase [Aeromonas sp. RU39B]|uniref:ROK family protein n=1 Tax=Aeromonas sp. RU39B TaxID=1907416 RepID=UPI000954204D|nr:ROK family protein [Aeromonas sp. RU39B]SIQ40633.1 fructokinase [Aeromonas sp. RU39B]